MSLTPVCGRLTPWVAAVLLLACRRPAPPPQSPTDTAPIAARPPLLDASALADVARVDAPSADAAPSQALPPIGGTAAPSPAVMLAVGHHRACAVRADGRVVCWGEGCCNGDDSTPPVAPTLVQGIADVTQIAGDNERWCALRRGGEVRCWGDAMRTWGPEATGVQEVTASCVRLVSGSVSCATQEYSPSYAAVANLGPARTLGQGSSPSAILPDGSAWCWGYNQFHECPIEPSSTAPAPVRMTGLVGVDEIGRSQFVGSCARIGARVLCWGGEGSTAYRPVPLRGLANVVHLAVGEYHSCALLTGGRVSCWGFNQAGQLGRPIPVNQDPLPPGLVPGVTDAVEVRVGGGEPAAGCGSTCVRNARGEVRCWGSLTGSATPTLVDLSRAQEPAAR